MSIRDSREIIEVLVQQCFSSISVSSPQLIQSLAFKESESDNYSAHSKQGVQTKCTKIFFIFSTVWPPTSCYIFNPFANNLGYEGKYADLPPLFSSFQNLELMGGTLPESPFQDLATHSRGAKGKFASSPCRLLWQSHPKLNVRNLKKPRPLAQLGIKLIPYLTGHPCGIS